MARVDPPLTGETGTLATGVITVSGALTGLRTFATALADGDVAHVVVQDANVVHSWRDATWDETAGTLTLGTEEGNTGSLSDGAVSVWAVHPAGTLPNGQTVTSAAGTLTMACVEGAIASYQATLTEAVELALSSQPTAPAMARVVLYATAIAGDRDISLPTGWLARGSQTWPLTLTTGSSVEIQISTDPGGDVWASYAEGIAQ